MVKVHRKVPVAVLLGAVWGGLGCQGEGPPASGGEEGGRIVERAEARAPVGSAVGDRARLPDARIPLPPESREASLRVDTVRAPQGTAADRLMLPSPPKLGPPPPPPAPTLVLREKSAVERRPPRWWVHPGFDSPEAPATGVLVPAGSRLHLEAESRLSSRWAWPGDRFRARVVEDVLDPQGMVLVPVGAVVEGVVSRAVRAEAGDEDPVLELEARALLMAGRAYDLDAEVAQAELRREEIRDGRDMAEKAVAGAAAGAILGRILGKDTKSTVAGAVAGAAAGAGVAAATGRPELILDRGARLEIVLRSDLRLPEEPEGW